MSLPQLYKIPHETDTFTMPEPGTQNCLMYACNLAFSDKSSILLKGMDNIPIADVELLSQHATNMDNLPEDKYVSQLKAQLASLRLMNRICEKCGYKQDIKKLKICTKCGLTWYCSDNCQQQDHSRHILRCANVNGPLDTGYQQLAFLKIKDDDK